MKTKDYRSKFQLRVSGDSISIQEFVETLKGNRDEYFTNIDLRNVDDMEFNSTTKRCVQRIDGFCDISIDYGLNGGYGLMNKYPLMTSLELESKTHNLDIEVYGENQVLGFEEHYFVSNGNVIYDEITDIDVDNGLCGFYEWKFHI